MINGECQIKCYLGYYNHNGRCLSCTMDCAVCNNSRTCIKCEEGMELTDRKSVV